MKLLNELINIVYSNTDAKNDIIEKQNSFNNRIRILINFCFI